MNHISLKLKSITKNINVARNTISLIVVDKNPTVSFINELKTIVSEGVTNSIIHGYDSDENNYVYLEVFDYDTYIEIIITDQGMGIDDLEQAQEPMFTTKYEDDRSGLGFTIMKMFSDEFFVESSKDNGTKIKIIKKYI